MYIENVKAKIISGKNYFVKDDKGERTDELSIMNLVLMFDFKKNQPLANKTLSAFLAKPKDNNFAEDYEKIGYKGIKDLHNVELFQDVLISGEFPLVEDYSKSIVLYDMQII